MLMLPPPCSAYSMVVAQQCASALFHIAVGGFTALRGYAISHRSVSLAALILAFSLVPAAIDYEIFTLLAVESPEPVDCTVTMNVSAEVYRIISILGEVSNIFPEILVLAATWRRTLRFTSTEQVEVPLTTTLLRDGQ
ncbi:hypothetical protein DAEQUDRAFT_445907 [Daedalea quercina L-15889]|uniref:Uncharacterized protein n=1 Tax=Daedalea quercina L-15889 TaxID=1314783 RepID=A0A165N889_9APHY|nr:hypothetical protein DAEQUDRAFT_445907 [Daedalea quercina L-15889]